MGDNVKDKFKGFMKKVNNSFTSSSSSSNSKFQGQPRVLGSSSSSPSPHNPTRTPNPNPKPDPPAQRNTPPQPQPTSTGSDSLRNERKLEPNGENRNGFDPFDALITSGRRNKNGYSLNNVFECPVCNQVFGSEEDVSLHVESCLSNNGNNNGEGEEDKGKNDNGDDRVGVDDEVEVRVRAYVAGKPREDSVDVVLRLLRNVVKEPQNGKFRRVRMSNSKIRENVGEVAGCVELLECVGFELREEQGEMWAVMDVASEENLALLRRAISLLDPREEQVSKGVEKIKPEKGGSEVSNESVETKPTDRQTRIFFSTPGNVAARIEVPESFYNLSSAELRKEAEMRKKKIADSQLLVPKSYREKQAKAARRRYNKTLIRVQFPDGVVLQGIFYPWEPTSNLYEFVSSALKQPGLEFELMNPVPFKRRVIPCFPNAGEKATLEEEELVPSALIKFKPVETDSLVFTGLRNELLEASEPLVSKFLGTRYSIITDEENDIEGLSCASIQMLTKVKAAAWYMFIVG
ncbi:Plant UBX domain-containing protein [Drosera capensis]